MSNTKSEPFSYLTSYLTAYSNANSHRLLPDCLSKLQHLELPLHQDNHFNPYAYRYQATYYKPNVDLSLGDKLKNADNWSELFDEYLQKHDTAVDIHTDGSKIPGLSRVGAAVFCPRSHHAKTIGLEKHCSIFTAECTAIIEAIGHCLEHPNCDYIIFKDSLSALHSLASNTLSVKSSYLISKIKTIHVEFVISNPTNYLKFVWIPSYIGIPGNEVVDALAKSAITSADCLSTQVPFTDFFQGFSEATRESSENCGRVALYVTNGQRCQRAHCQSCRCVAYSERPKIYLQLFEGLLHVTLALPVRAHASSWKRSSDDRLYLRWRSTTVDISQMHYPSISKHDALFATIPIDVPTLVKIAFSCRDFKSLDPLMFDAYLAAIDWASIISLRSVDSKVEAFISLMVELFDRYAPYRTIRLKKNWKPGFTDELRTLVSRSPRRGLTRLAIDGAQHSHDEVRSENHTHKTTTEKEHQNARRLTGRVRGRIEETYRCSICNDWLSLIINYYNSRDRKLSCSRSSQGSKFHSRNLLRTRTASEADICADLGSRGAPASVPTEVSCNKYNCVIGSWLHETRLASRRTRYQNHSKNDYEKL
ncbi:unnamed protein product [Trichogramma brassicae]|uniref:RNase H type-1 domain-containing protein n=1 Tax=Trichogramma brassicae TaxID=86971 RepID=A0A6H5IG65_9HYME|nr:unnamed protein product [Trichogramma brassicae]